MEETKYDVDKLGEMTLREMIDGINNMTDTLWYVVQDLRAEVEQLEFKISVKDDTIDNLKCEIEGLHEEIDDLEDENDSMEEQLEELRNEM